jgi:hypothetical protein
VARSGTGCVAPWWVGARAKWHSGCSPHKLLLQLVVEDVVQPGMRRKLEVVGDIVDDGCDAVRPVEVRP